MQIVHRKQRRDWSASPALKIQVVQSASLNALNFIKLKENTEQLVMVCITNVAAFAQKICLVWSSKISQRMWLWLLCGCWLNWCSKHCVSKKSIVLFFLFRDRKTCMLEKSEKKTLALHKLLHWLLLEKWKCIQLLALNKTGIYILISVYIYPQWD